MEILKELKALSADLKPDMLAITETWTNGTILNSQLSIPGYNLIIRKDRADTTDGRGGGILMYAKSGLICHEIDVPVQSSTD